MRSETWWFVARATGLVGWGLLLATVVLGLLMSTRLSSKLNQAWAADLHRFIGGFTAVALLGHFVALIVDSYVQFDVLDLVVPFRSDWHPIAVAWGIFAFYLWAVIEISSLLRPRIGKRTWMVLHQLALPTWLLATVHMLTAGADKHHPVLLVVLVASLALVSLLFVLRVLDYRGAQRRARSAARAARGRPAPRSRRAPEQQTEQLDEARPSGS
jgi:DMSO/TMAO reductase YedYZ heme-binding membrane subunit